MTTKRLWYLVLVAAVLQVAVPALRELAPLWLASPFEARRDGLAGRHWPHPPPPTGELGALARAGYRLPVDPPGIWQAFETALGQAPGSEALLIERARRMPLRGEPNQAQWARRAALAVTQAYPDNAVGWYLLATAEHKLGHRDAAFQAISRGNRAPRLDDRELIVRQARVARRMSTGLAELEAWLESGLTADDTIATNCLHMAKSLTTTATPTEQIEVAALGARLRDGAVDHFERTLGIAIQTRVYTTAKGSRAPSPRRDSARRLASVLRADGHPELAAWVEKDVERHVAFMVAAKQPHGPDSLDGLIAWTSLFSQIAWWMTAVRLAALLVLIGAAIAAVAGRLPASDDTGIPRCVLWALLPHAVLGGLALVAMWLPAPIGTVVWRGTVYVWICVVMAPLPLVIGWQCAQTSGRALRPTLLATAALLILGAWLAQVPAVAARRAGTRLAIAMTQDSVTWDRRAMDTAAPARLLPPEARP